MSYNPILISKRRNRFLLMWKFPVFVLLNLTLFTACMTSPASPPLSKGTPVSGSTANPTSPSPSSGPLPGQEIWKDGVSSYLFGTNDSVDYSNDNFVTDPRHIIQSSLRSAQFQIMREFIFHYSIIDGHRTTLGTNPQIQLDPNNPHEYDTPAQQQTTVTPNAPYGYELETRVEAIENSGMQCMIVLPSIWTEPSNPTDPLTRDHIYTDPATGLVETDFDFDKKVVAYLGNRCNLYEIGNEPDLDSYPSSGPMVPHLKIDQYMERWNEFVPALRAINPNAKFIGPVTYNAQGNDCVYLSGDCYMRLFLEKAKASGVLPDAVSFHWYPCDNAQFDSCLQMVTQSHDPQYNPTTFGDAIRMVKRWIRQILGKDLPVGITEWNFDAGSNPLGENADFMTKFTNLALNGPNGMISAGLAFANQFDAQDYGGYGHLDMFDITKNDQPKAQFYAIKNLISQYKT